MLCESDMNTIIPYNRRVAGITSAKAKNILKWREDNGSLICREQLKAVKGLGPKTIEQCVGFIRVMPETSGSTTKRYSL